MAYGLVDGNPTANDWKVYMKCDDEYMDVITELCGRTDIDQNSLEHLRGPTYTRE